MVEWFVQHLAENLGFGDEFHSIFNEDFGPLEIFYENVYEIMTGQNIPLIQIGSGLKLQPEYKELLNKMEEGKHILKYFEGPLPFNILNPEKTVVEFRRFLENAIEDLVRKIGRNMKGKFSEKVNFLVENGLFDDIAKHDFNYAWKTLSQMLHYSESSKREEIKRMKQLQHLFREIIFPELLEAYGKADKLRSTSVHKLPDKGGENK